MFQRVLGLVPARGGSKGIPRKNARKLGSKYLLEYAAESARNSGCIDRIVLSTDDEEIAEIGRACGLDVPFMRPADLSTDRAPMIEVVKHAINALGTDQFEAVCLLQPTSPLRSASTIRACVERLWTSGADSVVSVHAVPTEFNPHWVYFMEANGSLRLSTGEPDPIPSRQLLPPAFHRDGNVFVTKSRVVLSLNSLYGSKVVGVISPAEEICDLDTEEQWDSLLNRIALYNKPR